MYFNNPTPEQNLIMKIIEAWSASHMKPEIVWATDYEWCDLYDINEQPEPDEPIRFHARMSAHGYMDATDWTPLEDEHGLIDWLVSTASEDWNEPCSNMVEGSEHYHYRGDVAPFSHGGTYVSKKAINGEHWVVRVQTMDEGDAPMVCIESAWIDPAWCSQEAKDCIGLPDEGCSDVDLIHAQIAYEGVEDDNQTWIAPVEWMSYNDPASVTLARFDQVNMHGYLVSARFGNLPEVVKMLADQLGMHAELIE